MHEMLFLHNPSPLLQVIWWLNLFSLGLFVVMVSVCSLALQRGAKLGEREGELEVFLFLSSCLSVGSFADLTEGNSLSRFLFPPLIFGQQHHILGLHQPT